MRVRINSGFTLIELLVTLAVVAIVATIAVPAMSDMVTRSRTTAAFNELHGLVGYARSESAKSPGDQILLCSSANSTSCTGQADWGVGWLITRDANANGVIDSGDTILKVVAPLSSGIDLKVKTGVSTKFDTDSVSLIRNGAPANGDQVTFKLCDPFGASEAKGIVLSVSGQARAAARDSSGNREDHNNVDFQC